jgi:hypothetical protein
MCAKQAPHVTNKEKVFIEARALDWGVLWLDGLVRLDSDTLWMGSGSECIREGERMDSFLPTLISIHRGTRSYEKEGR